MARPRTTGSLEWVGDPSKPKATDHWRCRVAVDGGRRWINLPPTVRQNQRSKAEKLAHGLAAKVRDGKLKPVAAPVAAAPSPAQETLEEWAERWWKARRERGLKGVAADRSRFATWVLPRLGKLPVATLTRADVEGWVEHIDAEVQRGRLAWKTAHNAWGLLSRAMADAAAGKVKALRVRSDNPTREVAPPERGVAKAKPYLYPDEFLALMSCEAIPLAVRRAYAVTIYLYFRAGEIAALHWEDIDLAHGTVHVHRALDRDTRVVAETKGKAARRFELERELVPLLKAMRKEQPQAELVFDPWPLDKDRAGQLRAWLKEAGITRAELFVSDRTRKNLTFHDLRATGTTWAAIGGDEPLKIMHRAGHKDLSTTMGYVREAENVRRGFGRVFPPLPQCLLGEGGTGVETVEFVPPFVPRRAMGGSSGGEERRFSVRGQGFEP